MGIAADIDLSMSWYGDKVRISGAVLNSAADADKMIRVLTVLRAALPGGEETEPQGHSAHPAPAASEGAHNPTSDAPHSAQAEAPEAGVSEHPEAHSMATGGEKDAGTSASGHESEATLIRAAVPMGTESATRKDAVAAASDPNADGPSAGGRAEIDASPAAPISETTGPRPSAGEAIASPAPKRRNQALSERQQAIIAAHKDHSDWACADFARHFNVGAGYMSNTLRKLGLSVPPKSFQGGLLRPDSLAGRMRAYVDEHPGLTADQLAEALGEPVKRIRDNAGPAGVKLARQKRGRPPRAEQPKPVAAPSPKPTLVRPSAAKPEPTRPGSVIVRRDPVHPTGRLFWLRDEGGKYLHRFCMIMTSDRRDAWTGTEAQLVGCRKKFPLARDLREYPVEKEQARAVA